MLERMIKIQDSLCLYAGKHNIPQISPLEWLQLKKIVALLQPFEEITRNMSDSSTSISSVIPLIHTLKHTLQIENNKPDTNENFKALIKSTTDQLNSRFGELHLNNFYAIATYLDPRYKTNFFNEVTKEKVLSEIITLLCDNVEANINEVGSTSSLAAKRPRLPEPEEDTTTSRNNIQSLLSDILMSSDEDDEHTTAIEYTVDKSQFFKGLINEYNREKRIAIHEDPLMWWRSNTKFQALYSIARQYLSCPPGSVASEQLFSGAGLIYDPLRNRLDGDKASKLLFVKYNLLLLQQLNLM